jgi:PAS domain S-box-containing protein
MAGPVFPEVSEALRSEAEKILKRYPRKLAKLKGRDTQTLLHELSLYQIELEMQNEKLWKGQTDLQESHKRHADLYHSAPVAYLTLDEQGLILEANPAAFKLLGIERGFLLGRPLAVVLPSHSRTFHGHIGRVVRKGYRDSCEVILKRSNGCSFPARFESISFLADGRRIIRTTISDITEEKQGEERSRLNEEIEKRVGERTSELQTNLQELETRLREAQETIEAIRTGAVDAIIVSGEKGEQVFT